MYDLIIIGAGPAGLTAGIYASRSGLKTLIIEKESVGGQMASSPKIQNYPGYKNISGADLANAFFDQVMDAGCDFEIDNVIEIKDGDIKKVICEYGQYTSYAVIVATGAKHRTLKIENENNLIGKKVHFCASCDGAFYKDKVVAVAGGGNSALTNAIYLSGICDKVYLFVREEYFAGEQALVDEVNKKSNIEIYFETVISEYPKDNKNLVKINNKGNIESKKVDGIFLSIGLDPCTALVEQLLNLDSEKYIESFDTTTNKTGIFTCGDCRTKQVRQITTAISDGAIAATKASSYIKSIK